MTKSSCFDHDFGQALAEIVIEEIFHARYPFKDWANVPQAERATRCECQYV
ncbi:MAG: hypothetical protein ACJ8DI_04255 [Ktedonobacteraceae bacterium]